MRIKQERRKQARREGGRGEKEKEREGGRKEERRDKG
jgi:hypothetical protein